MDNETNNRTNNMLCCICFTFSHFFIFAFISCFRCPWGENVHSPFSTLTLIVVPNVELFQPGVRPYDPFRTQARVRLQQLEKEEYTGREGYIERREADTGRYRIQLDPSDNPGFTTYS